MAVASSSAHAQTVLNPTKKLSATLTSASYDFANGTTHEQQQTRTGLSAPLLVGARIDVDGTIDAPPESQSYLPLRFPSRSGSYPFGCPPCGSIDYTVTGITATLIPTSHLVGRLDPFTGQATAGLRGYFRVNYQLHATYSGASYSYQPTNCTVGSPGSPLEVTFTTGLARAPAGTPNPPITGIAYSEADGTLGLVNNTIALPNSSGDCAPTAFGYALFSFDQDFGLPSPSGHNALALGVKLTPIIHRGVIARLHASRSSGHVPLRVTFDASATQAPAGVASYGFDFTGDGMTDQTGAAPAARFTFTQPGVYMATVTVIDTDGDSDVASTRVTVLPPRAPNVTSDGPPTLALSRGGAVVDDGQVIRCSFRCVVHVTARRAGGGVSLKVGAATLKVGTGRHARIRFRLNRAGRRLLASHHRLNLKVVLAVNERGRPTARFVKRIVVRR